MSAASARFSHLPSPNNSLHIRYSASRSHSPAMLPLCLPSPSPVLFFLPSPKRFQTLALTQAPAPAPSPLYRSFLRKQSLSSPRTLTLSLLRSSLSGDTSTSPPLIIDELIERDWSFLDYDAVNSDEEYRRKNHLIISAGGVRQGSRVLVCMGSGRFVDRLVESAPSCELLLVIHESLFVLAMIKEMYDKVRCWQGEITALPERFSPFDAVFVCYFPGMGVPLDQLLSSVASRCSPGARLLISFDQGKEVIEGSHRQQYPDMVTSELPERTVLEKAAADHLFQVTEFADEPTFYLAVLTFTGSGVSAQ